MTHGGVNAVQLLENFKNVKISVSFITIHSNIL